MPPGGFARAARQRLENFILPAEEFV